MQPSAAALRTAADAPVKAGFNASMAAALPIRPSATAAADATSLSVELRRFASPSTAWASSRTPIELITPISSRPLVKSSALRNASSAAGSGITSSAIRAQDDSSSSSNSGAKNGTARPSP
jgi:hypothetical protein